MDREPTPKQHQKAHALLELLTVAACRVLGIILVANSALDLFSTPTDHELLLFGGLALLGLPGVIKLLDQRE